VAIVVIYRKRLAWDNHAIRSRRRTSMTTHNCPARSSRISSITTGPSTGTAVRTFTHDGAGNITQNVRSGSGTYNYTMNQRNRLSTARVGITQVGSYVYDALERLAIRTTSNVTRCGPPVRLPRQ